MTEICVSRVKSLTELGARWRDLEQRANASFFQTWTWTGCLANERFPDPVLVEATQAGRTVALALFNRVRHWLALPTLHLNETGKAEKDCPYIEQNGVLAESSQQQALTELCLSAVASRHDLTLSGIGERTLAATRTAAGLVQVTRAQPSPYVDLTALKTTGLDYLATRSANTRQQIRRSDRFYQQQGPIKIQRANSLEAAQAMLEEMANLHQATWHARGRPGSFSRPFFRRFHQQLISTALPLGQLALLKIVCNETTIGILYNFIHNDRMLAYQSGFAPQPDEAQAKPGLTCHHRAIQWARDENLAVYDFLAGADRYKQSLAAQSHQQFWLNAGPIWSPRLLLRAAAGMTRASIRKPKPE